MTDTLSTVHHLIEGQANTQEIYRSSNGDNWQLIRQGGSGVALVRHTANRSSGGTVTELTVEQFLAFNAHGPEHDALRVLMDQATNTPTP
jgi:hypothetical protein